LPPSEFFFTCSCPLGYIEFLLQLIFGFGWIGGNLFLSLFVSNLSSYPVSSYRLRQLGSRTCRSDWGPVSGSRHPKFPSFLQNLSLFLTSISTSTLSCAAFSAFDGTYPQSSALLRLYLATRYSCQDESLVSISGDAEGSRNGR
jgi:hypothetical protein